MTTKPESALEEFRAMSYPIAYDISSVTGYAVKAIKIFKEFEKHFMMGNLESIYDRLQAVATELGLEREAMLKILVDADSVGIMEAFKAVLTKIGTEFLKKKYTYVGLEGVVDGKDSKIERATTDIRWERGKIFPLVLRLLACTLCINPLYLKTF
jgi:hypothetical protein